jgi:hypothetical protein
MFLPYKFTHPFIIILPISAGASSGVLNHIGFANKWLWKLGIKTHKNRCLVEGWLSFAHKTDETRIENIPYLFNDQYQGTPIYITEKADGTSGTFAIYKDLFYVASRNRVLYCKPIKKAIAELKSGKIYGDKYVDAACKYSLPKEMAKLKLKDVVIQDEIVGPGIQKNPMGLSEVHLMLFNVFIPIKQASSTTPLGLYLG